MKQILIFGTGISAEKVLVNLKKDVVCIKAFLDNNVKKQGKEFHGVKIVSPAKCLETKYDFIIIASVKYEPITQQLIELGVDKSRLLSYFAFDHKDYDRFRKLLNMEGVIYDEMNLRMENMQKYLFNIKYEVADAIKEEKLQIPKVKTIDETIDDIIEKRLSISRYGDGEFDQIDGRREGYQEPNEKLSERLKEILVSQVENHVVGLADIYGDLSHLEDKYANYFRNVLINYRQDHYKYIDMNREYYNAFISRLYSEMKDKTLSKVWFDRTKKIWQNRNIIIVEGDKTRFGVGNDLMDNAQSVRRILAPNEGAFEKYDEILDSCKKYEKDVLYILALGPTATVLAYDLAKEGYQAIDIGHFDIEYEWYLRNVQNHKVAINGKYTNEVVGGNIVGEINNSEYMTQIIEKIF